MQHSPQGDGPHFAIRTHEGYSMPRRNPPPQADPGVTAQIWFARLTRAVAEQDWPLAVLMRDELAALGWNVSGDGRKPRQTRRKEGRGE